MYAIVGLGNPGRQYQSTRHNIGFEVIDYLSKIYAIKVKKIKHKAIIGDGIIQNEKVILVKPQTYMNNSGICVREIRDWYKIDNDKLIIIYDDTSLDIGRIRVRAKGSDGGHNGIKSIIYHLITDEFPRIKVGIGEPRHPDMDLSDFVLSKFTSDQEKILVDSIKRCANAIEKIIGLGISEAMNEFNGPI